MTRIALFAAAAALACSGPVGPFPNGRLEGVVVNGSVTYWPSESASVLELEADPADPYSVNVHFVTENGQLWVATVFGGTSTWARRVLTDGRVRVREGDSLWELRAIRVIDPSELARVNALYQRKYIFSPRLDAAESTLVFRLDPR